MNSTLHSPARTGPVRPTRGLLPAVRLGAAALALALLGACASTARSEGTGEYVDDTVITAKVKSAVMNEPGLKSAEINVETFKGRVQLSGFVGTQGDIDRATSVARGVSGVVAVNNDMRLK